jgi:hypothetical protein
LHREAAASSRPAEILVVGLSEAARQSVEHRLLGVLGRDSVAVRPEDLTDDRLGGAMIVVSPVMGPGFDAVELAERLRAARFRGRWLAFAEDVPYRKLIVREIGEAAPGLRFDVVVMGRGPRLPEDA